MKYSNHTWALYTYTVKLERVRVLCYTDASSRRSRCTDPKSENCMEEISQSDGLKKQFYLFGRSHPSLKPAD